MLQFSHDFPPECPFKQHDQVMQCNLHLTAHSKQWPLFLISTLECASVLHEIFHPARLACLPACSECSLGLHFTLFSSPLLFFPLILALFMQSISITGVAVLNRTRIRLWVR